MKGLGRNVRFMTGIFHKSLIRMYLVLMLCWVVFFSWRVDIHVVMTESVPFFLLIMTMLLVLMGAGSYSEMYCPVMVSFGSARRPAAMGIVLSQHIFLVEQFVILFVLALLLESEWMQAIRSCPLGLIAVLLILQGVGFIVVSLSMRRHVAWALVLAFALIITCIVVVVMIGFQNDFVWNADMLKPYNSPLILLAGLVMDIAGTILYYKTVAKVDLKLA